MLFEFSRSYFISFESPGLQTPENIHSECWKQRLPARKIKWNCFKCFKSYNIRCCMLACRLPWHGMQSTWNISSFWILLLREFNIPKRKVTKSWHRDNCSYSLLRLFQLISGGNEEIVMKIISSFLSGI